MEAFPYLGQMSACNNSNWSVVYLNLQKSCRMWGMVPRVIERTRSTFQSRVEMHKAVVQSVILYGSESLVVTSEMLKVLMGLHYQSARSITGMTAKRGAGGEWEYPLVVEAMEAAGLQPIGVYIKRVS